MDRLALKSYAKVNLTLDVLEKRQEDGYHNIKTVMVPVDLADQISLAVAEDLSVICKPEIPATSEENLAFRAADLLRRVTGYQGGATVRMEKVIPVAGGLAGGSTNAAAVLVGLNQLWGTGLSGAELEALAIRLGSDVPFFIQGVPARVEGIGERITSIPVATSCWLVLATPAVEKSTGGVYRLFDELTHVVRPDSVAMEQALASGDLQGIAGALCNVFEQVMLPRHPEIARLKEAMVELGALGALMSGAGPTVLGILPDKETGRRVLEGVRPLSRTAHLVQMRL